VDAGLDHRPTDEPVVREEAGAVDPAPDPAVPVTHRTLTWVRSHATAVICVVAVIGVVAAFLVSRPGRPASRPAPLEPVRYLGVYDRTSPESYAGISQFATVIGKQPDIAPYYSSWGEPFQAGFAATAAAHGATPLVQIDPVHVQLGAIAAGRYDAYLRSYAAAVQAYHRRVIIGFGHEMNGWWFAWGYQHASPAAFVAAWRHLVAVFRQQGASNVTWLWTVNIIDAKGGIENPAPWWPGRSYVDWVGLDGYYYKSSWTFAPLFGPTIKAVRKLTRAPILVSETGAARTSGQAADITDLFAGTRAYGLLGFVWFNANKDRDWRLGGPAAVTAFRRGARAYVRPAP
jgi:Glycosyl hydrolase family 26